MKTLFTVSNNAASIELEGGVLLSNTGASGGLTLLARKIIELQLKPISPKRVGRKVIRASNNSVSVKIKFEPAVDLFVTFVRLDG